MKGGKLTFSEYFVWPGILYVLFHVDPSEVLKGIVISVLHLRLRLSDLLKAQNHIESQIWRNPKSMPYSLQDAASSNQYISLPRDLSFSVRTDISVRSCVLLGACTSWYLLPNVLIQRGSSSEGVRLNGLGVIMRWYVKGTYFSSLVTITTLINPMAVYLYSQFQSYP